MNFDFLESCKMESEELQKLYVAMSKDLKRAELKYWRDPRECGIILRGVAEKICHVYNLYYEIGCSKTDTLEKFLCYTGDDAHNVMVSRFLSAVRKEQRDRLNKLRILGDDCMGEEIPKQEGLPNEQMSQNARRMMETMMETLKEMCIRINRCKDIDQESFLESRLPEKRENVCKKEETEILKNRKSYGVIENFLRKIKKTFLA